MCFEKFTAVYVMEKYCVSTGHPVLLHGKQFPLDYQEVLRVFGIKILRIRFSLKDINMSNREYVEEVCQHNFAEFRIFRPLDSCQSVDILKTYDQMFLTVMFL